MRFDNENKIVILERRIFENGNGDSRFVIACKAEQNAAGNIDARLQALREHFTDLRRRGANQLLNDFVDHRLFALAEVRIFEEDVSEYVCETNSALLAALTREG